MDLREMFREGWQWACEQLIKFWWRSGSRIWIRICIATLVRRALAEVCTVPMLLVIVVVGGAAAAVVAMWVVVVAAAAALKLFG